MKHIFSRICAKWYREKEKKPSAAHPTSHPPLSCYPEGSETFCPHLTPIYQAEIARDNSVVYINLNVGSRSIKVVYLAKALEQYDVLDTSVGEGTYIDYHFPSEKYYHCDKCRWMITGPLEDGQPGWYRPDAKEIVAPGEMVPPRIIPLSDGRWQREACFTNVINPRVIATRDTIVFEDGWQQFTYSDDWQILPTVRKENNDM